MLETKTTEELVDALVAKPLFRKKSKMRALVKASDAYGAGRYDEGLKIFLELWAELPDDPQLITFIASGLVQLGVRDLAVKVISRILEHGVITNTILEILQDLSTKMQLKESALKLATVLVSQYPDNPEYYAVMANALADMGDYDQGIQIASLAVEKFPDTATLWSIVGVLVRARDGNAASQPFLEEACRLAPLNVQHMNNLAACLTELDPSRAKELFEQCAQIAPDALEPQLALALFKFGRGDIAGGHETYDIRLDSRRAFGQSCLWSHQIPRWEGQDLTGKTLLIDDEQGIGDEIMFAALLPRAKELGAEAIYVSTQARLRSIYERSFPEYNFATLYDQQKQGYIIRHIPEISEGIQKGDLHIDYSLPIGSLSKYFWKKRTDIEAPKGGWLKPDAEKAAAFKEELEKLGPGLKIGICWQSGVTVQARSLHYFTLAALRPLAELSGVQFVNLQYGDVTAEIDEARSAGWANIHALEGVDLKQDIEANLALIDNLDLVIGPAVSTLFFAASIGKPVWWLLREYPWWGYGDKNTVPIADHGRFWHTEADDVTWEPLMVRVREEIQSSWSL